MLEQVPIPEAARAGLPVQAMLCAHETVLWLPKCWVLAASDTDLLEVEMTYPGC